MALKDIIGQERAINILKGCIARERVPHALLFAGDEGIGKQLTAINFAKALICRNEGDDSLFSFGAEQEPGTPDADLVDACDECPSCSKIESGNHPDFFFIGPEGDGGQITVALIRELEEAFSYKSFEGSWKIAVIDNADRLNQSAANAFLRTLEEPPPQSVFILVSSRPDMIIATIRSRCQRINFSPLPLDAMSSLLEEKLQDSSHEEIRLLSTLSGGRLGYALNDDLVEQRDRSLDVLLQLLGNPEKDVWDSREDMEQWFEWTQLWMRDIAIYKATGRTDLLINNDKISEIEKICRAAEIRDVLKLARELYNIRGRLFFNLNKQLTINYTSLLLKRMLGKINVRKQ